MSSILSLSSQAIVFATAMVVSTTVLFLSFTKQQTKNLDSQSQTHSNLRSCLLSSEEKKKEKKNKKKRVKFAETVKDTTKRNGKDYRKEKEDSFWAKRGKENSIKKIDGNCRNEMPANRIALYNGILRDRVHRIECSY